MKQEDPLQLAALEMGLVTSDSKAALNLDDLAARVNELIEKDFHQLISLLYRMDVSEPKLRALLKDNPGSDAGLLIAKLMVERQVQKIRSRQQYRQRDNDIDEKESW